MHSFLQAFKFIGRDGSLPGIPGLPSLVHLTVQTLGVAALGVAIACAIALPLGIWLGHLHRGSFLAINVGNVGRALPSLAVLAIAVALLGLGLANVEVALVILAVPPIITNAYTAVDGVDRDLVDAARGMGMSGAQIVRQVELPLALPLMFAGIRTASVFVVATTPIASLTGYSGTLGDIINNEASYHLAGVLGAAICIAALALVVELVLAGIQRLITPRALRSHSRQPLAFAGPQTVISSPE
jgi:osmoprotectant transport system permease protein